MNCNYLHIECRIGLQQRLESTLADESADFFWLEPCPPAADRQSVRDCGWLENLKTGNTSLEIFKPFRKGGPIGTRS